MVQTIVIEPNLVHPSEEDKKRWNIIEIPIITIAKDEVGKCYYSIYFSISNSKLFHRRNYS